MPAWQLWIFWGGDLKIVIICNLYYFVIKFDSGYWQVFERFADYKYTSEVKVKWREESRQYSQLPPANYFE